MLPLAVYEPEPVMLMPPVWLTVLDVVRPPAKTLTVVTLPIAPVTVVMPVPS